MVDPCITDRGDIPLLQHAHATNVAACARFFCMHWMLFPATWSDWHLQMDIGKYTCRMTGSVRMRWTSGSCMPRACLCLISSSVACPYRICRTSTDFEGITCAYWQITSRAIANHEQELSEGCDHTPRPFSTDVSANTAK